MRKELQSEKLEVPKGRYIVAVSGGVDSVTLLDLLSNLVGVELIVAHFNHGIRVDAKEDEKFVRQKAKEYKLPFGAGYGRLRATASEEQARRARYRFLNSLKQKHAADAIITAHHEDDLIETAILNIMRGSGRRGLSAIAENPDILRPLLPFSKKEILDYAKKHTLSWREDPTNKDERYLRNYIRRRIIPKLDDKQRAQFLRGLKQVAVTNQVINQEIANLSHKIVKNSVISRADFVKLPSEIATEVLIHFLRTSGIRQFDKKTIDRLSVAVKTAKAGSKYDVARGAALEMTTSEALLKAGADL